MHARVPVPMIARIAREIAELGPIARHSRRPALMAAALGAATFGLLPDTLLSRTIAVVALVVVAELALRLAARFGSAGEGPDRPVEPVIDRAAGAWCACWPLPDGPVLLVAAFVLYLVLARRGSGPAKWLRGVLGAPGTLVDALLGLAAGFTLLIISKV